MKLNLGSGGSKLPGFEGVDHDDLGQEWVVDLTQPWPWPDNSIEEIHASNIFEHLPDKFHSMNELYRVLIPGGLATLILPSTDGRGAWQDPTHVSYWNANSFRYWCSNHDAGLTALNRRYGFKGDFELLDLTHMEVPEKIIFVTAKLRKPR